ncbi:MAG: hypothetical protein HFG41_06455 [Coprococcus sp.]|nr:hypothetical protein [Coprococcus sp.]
MKKDVLYMNPEYLDISVEEFDALDGMQAHRFSDAYKKNKKSMMKKFRRGSLISPRFYYAKVASAAAFLLICTPIAVSAAANSMAFQRIWGNAGKDSVDSHEVVVEDEVKGSYTVTYPQRTYVDVDPQKAEELIGSHISLEPVVKELGDTKLTVLSAVTDGSAAVVEFTLEREGGVTALDYSQLQNEAKGASISWDADFYFQMGHDYIFVDLDKSTEDKLYCYDYIIMPHGIETLTLQTEEYPCTRAELNASTKEEYEKYQSQIKRDSIPIPMKPALKKTEFATADGGSIIVSPLSMEINLNTGLGLSDYEATEPASAYYVAIHYKDGSDYLVSENSSLDGKHTCETPVENTRAVCEDEENHLDIVFNRLVDPAKIESITVNETEYVRK